VSAIQSGSFDQVRLYTVYEVYVLIYFSTCQLLQTGMFLIRSNNIHVTEHELFAACFSPRRRLMTNISGRVIVMYAG
jgi:hypothetical protein